MVSDIQQTIDMYLNNHDIQDTSQTAYGLLRRRQFGLQSQFGKIITLLEKNPDGLSIGEIASLLGMQKSSISARIKTLRDCSVVIYQEHRDSKESGMINAVWVLSIYYKEHMELVD